MTLSLPFAWSDACLRHDPTAEVWVGARTPATEVPRRVTAIRSSLAAAGAREVAATPHGDEALLAVHDRALVDFLRTIWDEWAEADLPNDRVVPYLFHRPDLTGGQPPVRPEAVSARAGLFAYDTMTLIGPGTWEAARGAVDVALTAVDLVAGGERVAYACCRPPGHHVLRSLYGGSCYLNNAAVAAAELSRATRGHRCGRRHRRPSRERHAGALPQLRRDPHRLRARRPGRRLVPAFRGFASENDAANLNLPVAPGTADDGWLAAVREAAAFADGATALVVALGVDAAAGDPESPLQVTGAGYREAGRALGELGLPTVVVQEGGYDLASIGSLVVETLRGLSA